MKKNIYKGIFFLIFALFLLPSFTFADDLQVGLVVQGCNNNGICEASIGESTSTCPNDCLVSTSTSPTPGSGSSGGSGGGGSSIQTNNISNLVVTTDTNSAVITWNTYNSSRSTIRWGESGDFSSGSLNEITYSRTHEVRIENLMPGNTYMFSLEVSDINNNNAVENGSFTTKVPIDTIAPSNPSAIELSNTKNGVFISWINPTDPDFSFVRIMRSTDGYPKDPLTGQLVYEGGGQNFLDLNTKNNTLYFYSLFSRDTSGNYSSGVSTYILRKDSSELYPLDSTNQSTNAVPAISKDASVELSNLSLTDFSISQNGKGISFTGDSIYLNSKSFVTISIPKDKVPNIDQFYVLLQDDQGLDIAYLMRLDEKGDEYVATVPVFNVKSKAFSIIMKKIDQNFYTEVQGIFYFSNSENNNKNGEDKSNIVDNFLKIYGEFILWLLYVLILLFIFYKIQKKRDS